MAPCSAPCWEKVTKFSKFGKNPKDQKVLQQRISHEDSIHKNIRQDCLDCGKEFKQNSNFTRHIKTVHKRMKFKCDHCEKEFGQINIRKTHVKSVQEKI